MVGVDSYTNAEKSLILPKTRCYKLKNNQKLLETI